VIDIRMGMHDCIRCYRVSDKICLRHEVPLAQGALALVVHKGDE
jgi:hypothetical protein